MGMCVFWKGGEGKLKIKAELHKNTAILKFVMF